MTEEERFWSHVDKSGECWLWTGGRTSTGYGHYRHLNKNWKAHRFAWTLTNGPIAAGLVACHRCDTPLCVNPAHLFLGTQADNLLDMTEKGRRRHNPNLGKGQDGELNHHSKLTEADVREIRRQGATPYRGLHTALSRQLGISRSAISLILEGKHWKAVA